MGVPRPTQPLSRRLAQERAVDRYGSWGNLGRRTGHRVRTWGFTDYAVDSFLPRAEQPPATRQGLRVLAGSGLLGLAVAAGSLLPQLLFGGGASTYILAAFAVGVLLLLGALKAGASYAVLRIYALLLVGGFLFSIALVNRELHWQQLQWLVLLPLIALCLDEPGPATAGAHRAEMLGPASTLAIALGVLIVVFKHLGWTLGETGSGSATGQDVIGTVDFVLFVVSVTGLLRIQRLALRKSEEEVARLRSILRVCAWCGRLRGDHGTWLTTAEYLTRHTTAQLSHGICPSCEHRMEAGFDHQ